MGESMFARLLEDLRSAEHFIFMEYFIIEEGHLWNSILEILKEKAAAGVEVKVVYDDIGCMMTLPGDYFKTLRGFGIDATPFSALKGNADSEFNNRSHRKITVIDGKIGYTGGVNIADEYINEVVRSSLAVNPLRASPSRKVFRQLKYMLSATVHPLDQLFFRKGSGKLILVLSWVVPPLKILPSRKDFGGLEDLPFRVVRPFIVLPSRQAFAGLNLVHSHDANLLECSIIQLAWVCAELWIEIWVRTSEWVYTF